MLEREVDCRGMACPKPVMMARKALDEIAQGRVRVLVTQEVQSRNLEQLAQASGCEVEILTREGHYEVVISKPSGADPSQPASEYAPQPAAETPGTVALLLTSDQIGQGDPKLGALLTQLMLTTLAEAEPTPTYVLLMNAGVRLACSGSAAVEALAKLEERQVQVLVCGTCLQFLGLLDDQKVGKISNMYDIVSILTAAQRVVAL
ncbi:MAG: sulfurtransferase-like selenium metabolism protein YedF [Armatimonadota bacterium]